MKATEFKGQSSKSLYLRCYQTASAAVHLIVCFVPPTDMTTAFRQYSGSGIWVDILDNRRGLMQLESAKGLS